MAQKLGPLEIRCDAPPYNIVKGCALIGFEKPEDVRWLRRITAPTEMEEQSIRKRKSKEQPTERTDNCRCTCGESLEPLQAYTFQLLSGEDVAYAVGQCPRCHTVHWDYA
jgi:hypothetical protein